MKKIVFACQRAQGMVKEQPVLWLALTSCRGKCNPLSSMHGKLHWSALHYIFRSITDTIPKAPFPDSTCCLALEYPSWYARKLYTKFLMFFQLPHHSLGNYSSDTYIVIMK